MNTCITLCIKSISVCDMYIFPNDWECFQGVGGALFSRAPPGSDHSANGQITWEIWSVARSDSLLLLVKQAPEPPKSWDALEPEDNGQTRSRWRHLWSGPWGPCTYLDYGHCLLCGDWSKLELLSPSTTYPLLQQSKGWQIRMEHLWFPMNLMPSWISWRNCTHK